MDKTPKEIIDDSTDGAKLYVKTELEQFKLRAAKRITRYASETVKIFVLIAFGAVAALFLTLAIALAWGKAIESYSLAFLYMGLIVLSVLGILAAISDKLITRPILKGVIKEIFEEENE